MAANTGDFKNAGSNARGEEIGIIPPIAPNAPTPKNREADLYIPLSAKEAEAERKRGVEIPEFSPTTKLPTAKKKPAKEPTTSESLDLYTGITGKKAIGMNDTLNIAHKFVKSLTTVHANLSGATSVFRDHPDLKKAHNTLQDATNLLAVAGTMKKQVPVVDPEGKPVLTRKGQPKERNETPAAWDFLEKAGKQIQKAHGLLANISPEHVAGISHTHTMQHDDGSVTHITLTPQDGIDVATVQPGTGFREKGGAVNTVNLAGKEFTLTNQNRVNLAVHMREQKLGIKGIGTIRPDAVTEFGKKTAPTPRVRKSYRVDNQGVRKGSRAPKSQLPLVEPLGEAAVQPNKVGDWGGSEKSPVAPGGGYPRRAERIAKGKLRRAKTRYTAAARDYKLANQSTEKDAPTKVRIAKNEVLSSASDVARNIGEVKKARTRDVKYATGTPAPSPAQERVKKARTGQPYNKGGK